MYVYSKYFWRYFWQLLEKFWRWICENGKGKWKYFQKFSDGGLNSEDADIPLRKSYLPYKAIQNIIYNTIKSKKFIYGF